MISLNILKALSFPMEVQAQFVYILNVIDSWLKFTLSILFNYSLRTSTSTSTFLASHDNSCTYVISMTSTQQTQHSSISRASS